MKQCYETLQCPIGETCETNLEQNHGMEVGEAENKAFGEVKHKLFVDVFSQKIGRNMHLEGTDMH